MTLILWVSNTVGMTMPRKSLYSKGTDASWSNSALGPTSHPRALGLLMQSNVWAVPTLRCTHNLTDSKLRCITSLGVTITHGAMIWVSWCSGYPQSPNGTDGRNVLRKEVQSPLFFQSKCRSSSITVIKKRHVPSFPNSLSLTHTHTHTASMRLSLKICESGSSQHKWLWGKISRYNRWVSTRGWWGLWQITEACPA